MYKSLTKSPRRIFNNALMNPAPADLLPSRGVPTAGDRTAPVSFRELGDGNVELKINQIVSWDVALETIKRLKAALPQNYEATYEGPQHAISKPGADDVDQQTGAGNRSMRSHTRKVHGRRDTRS